MTTPPPSTFLDKYGLPSAFPSGPNPARGFTLWHGDNPTQWNDARLRNAVLLGSDTPPRAFIGLFPDTNHPTGTTRLLHAPSLYPSSIGATSSHDNLIYAFLNDTAGGTAVTVNFPTNAFSLTLGQPLTIPSRVETVTQELTADPTAELLTPLTSGVVQEGVERP